MNKKKMLLSLAVAGLATGLSSCKSSSTSNDDEPETTVTEAAFKESCAEKGGTLEEIASCVGNNTCAGESWHAGEVKVHDCAGMSECNGFNCLIPEENA